MSRVRICFLGCLLLIFAFCQNSFAYGPSFDQSLDRVVSSSYPQTVVAYLTSLGHRPAGTPADNAAASYFVREMRKIGIRAWKESVPLDVWKLNEASVTIGAKKIVCSTFTGVASTGPGGVTGDVVYIGVDPDRASFGDVTGKIVLCDWSGHPPDYIVMQAGKLGAKAVIVSATADADKFRPANAHGAGCSIGMHTDIPWVFMTRADADVLKAQLPATAKVTLNVTEKRQEHGGHGYNALAMIPGIKHPDEIIIISSHHDAHFYGAVDNSTAMALQLTLAKAIKLSDYRPDRTILFLSTTAEEAGVFSSYWNWMYGSYYFITQQHPEWVGKVVADINWEFAGAPDGTMLTLANKEFIPWLNALFAENPDYAPPAGVAGPVNAYSDAWNFSASGIPTIYLMGDPGWGNNYTWNYYHSDLDVPAAVNWTFWTQNTKLTAAITRGLDGGGGAVTGLLPYSIKERADDLAANWCSDPATLTYYGADAGKITRFNNAITALQAAGNDFENKKTALCGAEVAQVNRALLQMIKALGPAMTGASLINGYFTYPHDIIGCDLWCLDYAWGSLLSDPTDSNDYAWSWYLIWVDWNYYCQYFDEATLAEAFALQAPGYARLYSGALAHPAVPLNLWTTIQEAKTHVPVNMTPIYAAYAQRLADLNERLDMESQAIEDALVIYNALGL